jgi:hypothetical protein
MLVMERARPRVEYETDDERHKHLNDEVNKIIDALRSNGYEPHRHIEDITSGIGTVVGG